MESVEMQCIWEHNKSVERTKEGVCLLIAENEKDRGTHTEQVRKRGERDAIKRTEKQM